MLSHLDTQPLLLPGAIATVWCVCLLMCSLRLRASMYLILVFFTSAVGNLKPPNGIFLSPFANCTDTLMR